MTYHADEKGYYGEFGGAFIPEMLYPNVEELRRSYLEIMYEDSFQKAVPTTIERLCRYDPPRLYFAKRLSKKAQL